MSLLIKGGRIKETLGMLVALKIPDGGCPLRKRLGKMKKLAVIFAVCAFGCANIEATPYVINSSDWILGPDKADQGFYYKVESPGRNNPTAVEEGNTGDFGFSFSPDYYTVTITFTGFTGTLSTLYLKAGNALFYHDVSPDIVVPGSIDSIIAHSPVQLKQPSNNNNNNDNKNNKGTSKSLKSQDSGQKEISHFSIKASPFVNVPDGGSTAILLGIGSLALGLIARRR